MARTIVFANRKGGSGKTTTAINCAHGLSKNSKVLFVDMDAQAHASSILGPATAKTHNTINNVLGQDVPIDQAIYSSRLPNISIIPSSRELGSYELAAGVNKESAVVLADALSAQLNKYDYIIIDPPPTLGVLMVTSLVAAREVYIPMPLHFLAMEGLAEMMRVIYRLNAETNPDLRLTGIIPTFYNKRVKTSKKIRQEIETNFGSSILMPPIRNNIKLAESPAYGQTIFEYAPKSIGAADYQELVEYIANPGQVFSQ